MSRFNLDSLQQPPALPDPESIKLFRESTDKLSEMRQRLEEQTAILRKQFEVEFSNITQHFFKAVPAVKSVTWTQYTPYFMDGDVCEFSINDLFFASDENLEVEYYREFNDDSEFSVNSTNLNTVSILDRQARELCNQLSDLVSQNESFMQSLFDDHVMVILRPNGVHTEEYDHE